MSKEDFELTRDYLVSYSKLWAQTLSRRLGFLLDSKFYGTPYYIDEIGKRLATMTVDDVNRAAKKYLQTVKWEGVLVAGDAEALKAKLEADAPSPITYANAVPPDVTARGSPHRQAAGETDQGRGGAGGGDVREVGARAGQACSRALPPSPSRRRNIWP